MADNTLKNDINRIIPCLTELIAYLKNYTSDKTYEDDIYKCFDTIGDIYKMLGLDLTKNNNNDNYIYPDYDKIQEHFLLFIKNLKLNDSNIIHTKITLVLYYFLLITKMRYMYNYHFLKIRPIDSTVEFVSDESKINIPDNTHIFESSIDDSSNLTNELSKVIPCIGLIIFNKDEDTNKEQLYKCFQMIGDVYKILSIGLQIDNNNYIYPSNDIIQASFIICLKSTMLKKTSPRDDTIQLQKILFHLFLLNQDVRKIYNEYFPIIRPIKYQVAGFQKKPIKKMKKRSIKRKKTNRKRTNKKRT